MSGGRYTIDRSHKKLSRPKCLSLSLNQFASAVYFQLLSRPVSLTSRQIHHRICDFCLCGTLWLLLERCQFTGVRSWARILYRVLCLLEWSLSKALGVSKTDVSKRADETLIRHSTFYTFPWYIPKRKVNTVLHAQAFLMIPCIACIKEVVRHSL